MQTEAIDFEQAAARIAGHVRRTPLVPAAPEGPLANLWFKPECLQVSGSFKARGAFNSALCVPEAARARGLVTASGGNFGAALAHVARRLGVDADIVVMEQATAYARRRVEASGGRLHVQGFHWDESWDVAEQLARENGATLLHPFATAEVIAGQGTIGLEILEDLPDVDTVVVSIGGGGLIAGIASAIKARRPGVRIVGVETVGCPTLTASLDAGRVVKLETIDTRVAILGARTTAQINLDMIRAHVDEVVLVQEDRPEPAARWVWERTGLAVELGAATAVSAVLDGATAFAPDERIAVVLCGSGDDGIRQAGTDAAGA